MKPQAALLESVQALLTRTLAHDAYDFYTTIYDDQQKFSCNPIIAFS